MTKIPENKTPLFDNIRYCTRCCIPETQEGVVFDELGICRACQSSEQKIHIDWVKREKELRRILEEAKAKADGNYDCVLPLSGGKDSMFQAYVLTQVYGMKPLGVTFSHNWYSETGWYNLQNLLDKFNIDHVQFQPNRSLVNRIARKSIEVIGDSCWLCHSGIPSFVFQMAIAYKIPLMVWGESAADVSGKDSYLNQQLKFDREYFLKVSGKVSWEKLVCDYLTEKDMRPFVLPSVEEIEAVGVTGIHLGNYLFWDDERQTEFVRDHWDWKETEMEGTYKGYKSAECIMSGMHDFTCYIKRGYGRATWQASVDVRNGLLSQDEGFELIRDHDPEIPEALDYYLKSTGLSEEEFYSIMNSQKHQKLKTTDIPIKKKCHKNAEVIVPFIEQFLAKHRSRKDPREKTGVDDI
ncbi:N-acetyl sugar amidotransferase [Geobacter sp.]|uniref:N-acetyl sugar amidotransferase n=1 Tax=Geobacter sp. TaxID=46610 RepID=UPI0027B9C07B|nr:N-acetyl sugar amidotransferase [Geobacter sp.]